MTFGDLLKYFGHGIAFSIMFIILAIIWVFLYVFLMISGAFIGIIIGFGLLILIVGFINALVTTFLWFPVNMSFWSLLGHGFVLFIVLALIDLTVGAIPNLIFPNIATVIVTRIILAFLYGFIGKKIAGFWEEIGHEAVPAEVEAEWSDKRL